jgi:outer membrane protein TolC
MKQNYQYSLHLLAVVWLFLSSFNLFGQNIPVVSLQYCQTEAVTNYPSVKDKALLQAATELKLKNLDVNRLPSFGLNGQATYQSDVINITMPLANGNQLSIHQAKDQYKATLDINQLLFDGGTTTYGKRLEESSLAASLQQVEVDIFKVREQVNNVYFMLLTLQESQKLLSTTLNEIYDREKVVESSVKNGILIPSDLDVLKAEGLKTEQQLDDLKFSKKAAVNILSILINKPVAENSMFELPLIEVKDSVTVNRPEYKLFDLQNKQIEDGKVLTSTARLPKVFAFAQGGYGRPGLNMLSDKFNTYYIVGATFKWTIWDWNKTSRDRKVFDIQKQMITTRRESFDKNLNIDLQNKFSAIQKLQEYITRDSAIVEIRTRVAKSASSRLEHGVITSNDYLTELNAETIARINSETHKIQLIQAKANYLLAKGFF